MTLFFNICIHIHIFVHGFFFKEYRDHKNNIKLMRVVTPQSSEGNRTRGGPKCFHLICNILFLKSLEENIIKYYQLLILYCGESNHLLLYSFYIFAFFKFSTK